MPSAPRDGGTGRVSADAAATTVAPSAPGPSVTLSERLLPGTRIRTVRAQHPGGTVGWYGMVVAVRPSGVIVVQRDGHLPTDLNYLIRHDVEVIKE